MASIPQTSAASSSKIDVHPVTLASFSFEGEHYFRFSQRQINAWVARDSAKPPSTSSTCRPKRGSASSRRSTGRELVLRHRFGDVSIWRFTLVYEDCVLSAYDTRYPLCLDGERADVPHERTGPASLNGAPRASLRVELTPAEIEQAAVEITAE